MHAQRNTAEIDWDCNYGLWFVRTRLAILLIHYSPIRSPVGPSGPTTCPHSKHPHDLESLFYVFLWMAICHDGATSHHVLQTSRLHAWRGSDFLAVFHQKRKDMQPMEFEKWAEDEFTQPFRPYLPLATTIHQLLFPSGTARS